MPKKDGHTDWKQFEVVMHTFGEGKLRSSSGKTVTDPKQAKAIAKREADTAKERGKAQRTWHGRTRMRPKLVKHD